MRKAAWSIVLITITAFAGTGLARACDTTDSDAVFTDTFDTFGPTWGKASDELKVDNGKLVMQPKADYTLWAPNNAEIYEDVDFCAELTPLESVEPDNSFSGILFWYIDDDNYYAFEIDANGYASIWRRQRGRWLSQVDWVKSDLLTAGDGATNELRVVTKGRVASYYINGQLFREAMGMPPDNGQQIGAIASSPKKGVASYSFDNVTVAKPK